MARAAGLQAELSDLLGDMAVAYRRVGKLPEAIATNREAIDAARACGHDLNLARWSGNLGGLLYAGGDVDGAEVCFRDAVSAAARTDSPEQMSVAAGHFASVMGERGRFLEAVEIMTQARELASASPAIASIILDQELGLFLRWAYILRKENRIREAREVVSRGLNSLAGSPATKDQVLLLLLLGDLEENDGNIEAAVNAIEQAARACEAIGDRDEARNLRDLVRRMKG
jgi:tetratricopeptide (TPR) repeat protein